MQKEEKLKLGDQWVNAGLLFTQWNGAAMCPETVTTWIKKFINAYNSKIKNDKNISKKQKETLFLPNITLHSLRHTSATLSIWQVMILKLFQRD